jgi:hypothetical protein
VPGTPQWLGTPPPPQLAGASHPPHSMKAPQPSAIGPHSSASHDSSVRQTTVLGSGIGSSVKMKPLSPAWLIPSPPVPPSPSVPPTPGGLLPQANSRAVRPMIPNTLTLERTESSFGLHKTARNMSNHSRIFKLACKGRSSIPAALRARFWSRAVGASPMCCTGEAAVLGGPSWHASSAGWVQNRPGRRTVARSRT